MDSHEPTIEEKLVPFVEGALAEADRREVMQALPNSPALTQEVQQLREVIMTLRKQVDRGLSYESPVEAVSEQVVDFALESGNWSRPAIRQFQLHMLESSRLVEEVEILKELEQDLEQRLEGSQPVPEMPAALRAAIQEAYGKPPADPAWKKALAALVGWFAGMNLKVATAAVAGCLVIAAGVGVGRHLHQRMQAPVAASPALLAEGSTPTAVPSQPVAEAPAGQVALLKEKVLPEDLPGLSRRLWQKQVSHSYRDGQIFVAQADYEKAWSALQINSERVAVAKPLKTGSLPEARPTLPEGVIGMVPNFADKSKATSAPKADVAEKPEKASSAQPAPVPPANPAITRPSGPGKEPAVAVNLPASPEVSRGQETVYDYRQSEAAPAPPPPPPQGSSAPAVRPYLAAESAPPKPAAPLTREYSQPSQLARAEVPKQRIEHEPVAPAPAPVVIDQGVMGRARKMVATKGGEPAPEIQPVQKPSLPARPIARESKKSADPPAGLVTPPSSSGGPAPFSQDVLASRPPQGERNVRQDLKQEEEAAPPPMQPVAMPQETSSPSAAALNEGKERDGRVVGGVSADEAPESGGALARSENVGVYNSKINVVAPKAQANAAPNSASSTVGAARRTQTGGSSRAKDSGFEVQGNAPFEVAMLPVAKKLVEELVGEAKVQMERKEDGHLLVTIRPARSLSAQEVDKLRKVVREKLELEDEDTVVIRQP